HKAPTAPRGACREAAWRGRRHSGRAARRAAWHASARTAPSGSRERRGRANRRPAQRKSSRESVRDFQNDGVRISGASFGFLAWCAGLAATGGLTAWGLGAGGCGGGSFIATGGLTGTAGIELTVMATGPSTNRYSTAPPPSSSIPATRPMTSPAPDFFLRRSVWIGSAAVGRTSRAAAALGAVIAWLRLGLAPTIAAARL